MEKLCQYRNTDADWALLEREGQYAGCGVDHFDWNCDDIRVDSDEGDMHEILSTRDLNRH